MGNTNRSVASSPNADSTSGVAKTDGELPAAAAVGDDVAALKKSVMDELTEQFDKQFADFADRLVKNMNKSVAAQVAAQVKEAVAGGAPAAMELKTFAPVPSLGRIVIYTLESTKNDNAERAAQISKVNEDGSVHLHVCVFSGDLNFSPGDSNSPRVVSCPSRKLDVSGAPGTWRWPSRV